MPKPTWSAPALFLLLLLAAPAARAQDVLPKVGDTAYVAGPYRIFTGAGATATLDDVVAAMGQTQVVFIGEVHDDPTGHWLELELLRRAHGAAGSASRPVALSLEFFQRDVQLMLDEYLAGLITEKAFLDDSRPWPRYATDYRPLVEFARGNRLPVIAANAPRRYVSRVSRLGRDSLEAVGPEGRASLPPLPYGQPSRVYRDKWIRTISGVMEQEKMKCGKPIVDSAGGGAPPAGAHGNMGNQLHSQVLWDASMAWSISQHLARQPEALVLHMVGGFHVSGHTGTPEQLQTYRPGVRSLVIMLQPVADIEKFAPVPAGEGGDFVIQTEQSRTLEAIECRRLSAGTTSR
jgi:uncharacterized iron-regulated protein